MQTIKIAHLYYDLMNLYGEHGNVLALTHHLEGHQVKSIVHSLSIEDDFDLTKYDLVYIGCGNKEAFELVREDVLKRKENFKKALDQGTFFFTTGNSLDLFGKCYHTLDEIEEETLNFLSFESWEIDFRIVGEQVYHFSHSKEEVIGFQNRFSVLKFVKEAHLFDVKSGTGYVPKSVVEGIHNRHFYGTYLLGPLFIRNPFFTEYLIKEIFKFKNIEFKEFYENDEIKAYQEYKKNLLHEE